MRPIWCNRCVTLAPEPYPLPMRDEEGNGAAARWFADLTSRIRQVLPASVQRVLPTTFIGYAMINGSSFLLDMGLLAIITHFWQLPYSLAFSIGYALASVYAFFLNRWLNFREHGDLGKQSSKYAFVILSNYLIWIVGFGSFLDWAGIHVMVARVMAACLEGLYIYLMLRLWVFPRHRGAAEEALPAPVVPVVQPVRDPAA